MKSLFDYVEGLEEAAPCWGGACGAQHPEVTKAWVRCFLEPSHAGPHAGYTAKYVPRGAGGRLMAKPLLIHWHGAR